MNAFLLGCRAALRERSREIALLATAVLLVAAFRGAWGIHSELKTTLAGAEEFLFEPTGSSPGVIGIVSLWLFSRRAKRIRQTWGRASQPGWSLAFLAPALAVGAWGYWADAPALILVAGILAILGTAVAGGGFATLRHVALPALFLAFALPIPPLLLNQFMYSLQLTTATFVSQLMGWFGFSIESFAERVYFDGRIFQVIESCSGVRTLHTLLMAGILYLEIFPGERRRSLILSFATVPIALLINQLRIATIVLNPLSHFSAVHTIQGVVMLVVGVLAIAVADYALQKFYRPQAAKARRELAAPRGAAFWAGVGLSAFVSLVVVVFSFVDHASLTTQKQAPISSFPPARNGWTTEGLPLDREFLGSFRFSEWLHRRYKDEENEVEILAGTDERRWYGYSLYGEKHTSPGSGWRLERLDAGVRAGREVDRYLAVSAYGERRLVYRWFRGVDSLAKESWYSLSALDRTKWGRGGRALLVRLSAGVPNGPVGLAKAEASLEKFLQDFSDPIDEVLHAGTQPRSGRSAALQSSGSAMARASVISSAK